MNPGAEHPKVSSRTLIITVTATYTSRMEQVVSSLESSGLEVQRVLGSLGQIIGQGAESQVHTFEAVEGVASVDAEQSYQLPDPQQPTQ